MASTVTEATAIAFRRGTKEEVDVFYGLEGEMVVDTTDKTLVMCDGVQRGGYRMARADTVNLDVERLATRHGNLNLAYSNLRNTDWRYLAEGQVTSDGDGAPSFLLYNNLSNLTTNTGSTEVRSSISAILKTDYQLAANNLSNLVAQTNQESREATEAVLKSDYNLASTNAIDINTTLLAEGDATNRNPANLGKNLAYADTTNVNTADLVDATKHTEVNNNGNKPLAYADLSNVNLPSVLSGFEVVSNKSNNLATNVDSIHYTTSYAVVSYVTSIKNEILQQAVDTNLSNVQNWSAASLPSLSYKSSINVEGDGQGEGYVEGTLLPFQINTTTEVSPSNAIINQTSGSTLSNLDIDVVIFENNIPNPTTGQYTFVYYSNSSSWYFNGVDTGNGDLVSYGITYTGVPSDQDTLVVTYTEAVISQNTIELNIQITEVDGDGKIIDFEFTPTELINQTVVTTTITDPNSATPETFTISAGTSTPVIGGGLLKTDLSNVSEALNILRVKEINTQSTDFILNLDHKKAQVYPVNLVGDPTSVNITLDFEEDFDVDLPLAYVYEVHVTVGSTLPTINWLLNQSGVSIKWLQYVAGPVEANKTALYIFRQQRGQLIANYAGCY